MNSFVRAITPAIALLSLGATTSSLRITTIAGDGQQGPTEDGAHATATRVDNPFGVVRGPDGAIWFCQYTGQVISKVTSDGRIHLIAGNGRKGDTGDGGPARDASFNLPHELRFDRAGNLYVADMQNHAVRRVDAKTMVITTVVGTGQPGYSGDGGAAEKAQLNQPHSIQFGPDGSLYICDVGNNVIRRIDPATGQISTFAGTGKAGPTPDGSPIAGTPLQGPRSIDFDAAGNLWLVTRAGNQVLKFDLAAGKIHHVAGTGQKGFTGDGGPAREATFNGPKGIALAPNGDAYLADTENHVIRMIEAKTGLIRTVAGTGEKGDGPEGDPLGCKLARPHGVLVEKDGSIWIGDSEAHRLRVIRPN